MLALGAVLHEWGHLLAEGWRFDRAVQAAPDSGEITLPGVNPWLVEGIAEAWTDLVLAPIVAKTPLSGSPKRRSGCDSRAMNSIRTSPGTSWCARPSMPRRRRGPPHPVTLRHLIEAGEPAKVAQDPLFAATFRDPGDVAPLIIPAPSRRFLVPESIFTVDTRVPDPVSTIIRMPE